MKPAINKKWYAAVFLAVMAFAAGANMQPAEGCFLQCVSGAQSGSILRVAALGLTFNAVLWLSTAVFCGLWQRILSFAAAFVKMLFCGMCCSAAICGGITALSASAVLFSAFAAGGVCLCLLLDGNERLGTPLKRASLFIAGVSIEAVALPSLIIAAGI